MKRKDFNVTLTVNRRLGMIAQFTASVDAEHSPLLIALLFVWLTLAVLMCDMFVWQQLSQDPTKSVKDARQYPTAGRTEADPSSGTDKLLPLTLTIPPRCGMPPVTVTQPEQKFHRPFEVAAQADVTGHKSTKLQRSNHTPDRPPPPLLHRTTSERNGTAADMPRRQPPAVARLDVKFGSGSVDDSPLNLVVDRQVLPQTQHCLAPVISTNSIATSSVVSRSILPPKISTSEGWHRHRNKSDVSSSSLSSTTVPVVSLLDRKSAMRAARQKLSDGMSSDEETTNEGDDVAEAKRRARLLLIVSGPPLKPDSSPSKMNFLNHFRLVTSNTRAGKTSST